MKIKEKGVTLECVEGDIASQDDMEAVVNAANAKLKPGGGVAGAIHRKAGSKLYEECKEHAPIEVGEAVVTAGYDLSNEWVIHALGPVYNSYDEPEKMLRMCYESIIRAAEKNNISSLAIPAISTGAFGYPIVDATSVAVDTIVEMIPDMESLHHIRFVLYDYSDYEIYQNELSKLK